MVPSSWVLCDLGDFMDFKNGLNADKSQYGYGLKFVNVMDVFGNDILTEDKIIGRVNVAESQLEANLLKFGDVLFNRTSETFDEIAMSAVYLDDKPAVFGGFVIRARPNSVVLAPEYSVYLFQSSEFRGQVIKLGQGAVRANIGQKDLVKVKVLIPSLYEQIKIAQILSTWDKAISTTEQLLANSQQQKKALMQQLLTGKKRLLDGNGVRFGGEWRFLTFDDVFKVANKKSAQVKSSDYLATGPVPVVDQGKQFIAGYCDNTDRYTNVPVIIFGDHTRCVKWVDFEFCPGADGTQVLDTKDFLDKKFGYYLLCHTDIPNLGYSRHMRELKERDFKVPVDMAEQKKIAAVLSTADQELFALQQRLDALTQEKKALMQQLLSGKRRVLVS